MRKLPILIIFYFSSTFLFGQPLSRTFELRQFTKNKKANGETDFKGETQFLNIDQRIQFLKDYATFASNYFNDRELDKTIVTEEEINNLLKKIKPQPTTSIRKTISLDNWKAYGYCEGQDTIKQKELQIWQSYEGVKILDGKLIMKNTTINRKIDTLNWRFSIEATLKVEQKSSCLLCLNDGDRQTVVFGVEKNKVVFGSEKKIQFGQSLTTDWIRLKIEVDLTQKKYNLYVNNQQIKYFIPIMDPSVERVDQISIISTGDSQLDDVFIFNHTPTGEIRTPYFSTVILDEDFQEISVPVGWQYPMFDDKNWDDVSLPSAHGGLREKEEAYYLRTVVHLDNFKRAVLKIETVDPGGEIWVNGKVVDVIKNRHPVEIDITKYLVIGKENLIAVKVEPYKLNNPMWCAPTDHYIGWFLGRAKLELSHECKITDVMVYTKRIGEHATQVHKVNIQYLPRNYFEGTVEINYYPWFPEEGGKVASIRRQLNIPPRIVNEYFIECQIPSPTVWSFKRPFLYKVEVILRDKNDNAVDDLVTTTGIRTVEQKNYDFYINDIPEMLNGVQIMGLRTPIETTAKYNRCVPWETVAEELLMVKKMDANLLRLHVHAEKDTIDGINDPRYAEFADQMGIMLIWQTAGFIREGEAWNVDFEGYPKFMRQVFNHPSIVIWEVSNHPNKFKKHDISATHDYVKKIYHTVYSTDSSRLFSPTTFWSHSYYANSEGTLDYKGNKIEAVPEFTASGVTRGSQDAYTGYGNEWSELRKAPNAWAASCLQDKDRAYFNFEHEESIGQPNWELCKGKPWYLLQSYEWDYDEGSIGRKLTTGEWKESQAWQAFSAWESMKKQMLLGYDGFSWCCLRGGANMGTYKKPLIDNLRHPKLAFYTNQMVFQRTWAASNNVDVVYGKDDKITPVIHHLGKDMQIQLVIKLINMNGKIVSERKTGKIRLYQGKRVNELESFQFEGIKDGTYAVQYELFEL